MSIVDSGSWSSIQFRQAAPLSVSATVKTHTITADSPHLASVRELWRVNSATLGFFPQGAFEDHARQQGIIVALTDEAVFAGYLAFRRTRRRASIVHLCVESRFRGQGVVRSLFSAFRAVTSELAGASVTCRSDFAASGLWPRLGFAVLREEPAREPGKCLKRWWLDYGHPNLFSPVNSGLLAVLDANVFFDLLSPAKPASQESAALQADWLAEAFALAVTPEVYNEIDRGDDALGKEHARTFASGFVLAVGRPTDLLSAVAQLVAVLGAPQSLSDESDHRQLAHAISVGAPFFVTRDGEILQSCSALKAVFGIDVVRPSELVCRYDQDARPSAYSPVRLDGSALTIRRLQSSDVSEAVRLFQNFPHGETNAGLPTRLRQVLAQPDRFRADLVLDASGAMLGLEVSTEESGGICTIDVLRVTPGILGSTLARHALWRSVQRGAGACAALVRFLDEFATHGTEDALADVGFVREGRGWIKLLLSGTLHHEALAHRLEGGIGRSASVEAILQSLSTSPLNDIALSQLEKVLWPARITGCGLPCFVVPIKPRWAAELFDTRSASCQLFGADPALLLRLENAYYRSARPEILRAPGRLLWYSSESTGEPWSKHLCGTSILNRVVIDTPKAVFREFKRYGVFAWDDVRSLRSDSSGRIMAFAFSHSSLLHEPIPFARATEFLLLRTGKHYTFQSPIQLDEAVWTDLVAMGSPAVERLQ